MIVIKRKRESRASDLEDLKDILLNDGWTYESDDFFWTEYGFGVSVEENAVFVGTGDEYNEAVWEGSIRNFINGYRGVSGRPGRYGVIDIDFEEYTADWS